MSKESEPKLKPGDHVIRMLGGKLPMEMVIRKIENGLIYCEAADSPGWPDSELWRFEELTGAEYDPDLKWGSEWGATGSFLVPKVKPNGTAH